MKRLRERSDVMPAVCMFESARTTVRHQGDEAGRYPKAPVA